MPEKQAALLEIFVDFYDEASPLIRKGIPVEQIRDLDSRRELMRLKEREGTEPIDSASKLIKKEMTELAIKYEVN